MEIASDRVITFHYVLKSGSGEELDRSEADSPMQYLHGHSNIVPGLESRLVGKKAGDEFVAVVPPEEAYGRKEKLQPMRVPRSKLPADMEIQEGDQLVMEAEGQQFPVWVEKVQGPTVILSPQHPLAGEELHFEVSVVEVRDATEEEITHGHAHGPGGHHHH